MPKYVIEREIPGAGRLTPAELQGISQKSCGILKDMGPQIQWIKSYMTDGKVYCVYIAPDEETVQEHARRGEFPANRISEVKTVIDHTSAEQIRRKSFASSRAARPALWKRSTNVSRAASWSRSGVSCSDKPAPKRPLPGSIHHANMAVSGTVV